MWIFWNGDLQRDLARHCEGVGVRACAFCLCKMASLVRGAPVHYGSCDPADAHMLN